MRKYLEVILQNHYLCSPFAKKKRVIIEIMREADWNKKSVMIENQLFVSDAKKILKKLSQKFCSLKITLYLCTRFQEISTEAKKKKRSLEYLHIRFRKDKAEYTRGHTFEMWPLVPVQ